MSTLVSLWLLRQVLYDIRYKRPDRAYHIGDPADERMIAAAAKRGIQITSRSRPLVPQDLATFDHIVGMDFENIAAVQVSVLSLLA